MSTEDYALNKNEGKLSNLCIMYNSKQPTISTRRKFIEVVK